MKLRAPGLVLGSIRSDGVTHGVEGLRNDDGDRARDEAFVAHRHEAEIYRVT